MGKPVNKRNFGVFSGSEIKVKFNNGTAVVDGYIVSQKGSKTFRCSDGVIESICKLVNKDDLELLNNEMSITVMDDTGTLDRIVKISNRKVTMATSGISIGWNYDADNTDGYVTMNG